MMKRKSPLPPRKPISSYQTNIDPSNINLQQSTDQTVQAAAAFVSPQMNNVFALDDGEPINEDSLYSHYQSDSSSKDDLDALLPNSDAQKQKRAIIDQYLTKISSIKEAIKHEQNSCDENVNEYLKLASNADRNQVQRIKKTFENKNRSSAQFITKQQKKIENYLRKIKAIETYGLEAVHPRSKSKAMFSNVGQGLKGVGSNIKEGISGLSESIKIGLTSVGSHHGQSSNTEASHHSQHSTLPQTSNHTNLVQKRENELRGKTASADNLHTIATGVPNLLCNVASGSEGGSCGGVITSSDVNTAQGLVEKGSANTSSGSFRHCLGGDLSNKQTSEDDSSSITSGSGRLTGHGGAAGGVISSGSSASLHKQNFKTFEFVNRGNNNNNNAANQASISISHDLTSLMQQLREKNEECKRISDEIESMKSHFQAEYTMFSQNIREERYKSEHLEEQMNDLIELHQNEIENLKQNICDMEEKVQYQSEERLRDIQEMLESCQTRISRMEHQQHQHLQQLVNLDSLDTNSKARALVLKLINVLLAILQVVLFFVATLCNIVTPFLRNRIRILTTIFFFIFVMTFMRQKHEVSQWIKSHTNENFADFVGLIFYEEQ